jgi:hypothetical protein
MAKKNWIAGAIQHKGALTASAKRAGKSIGNFCAGKNLSSTDKKRCNLARTLKSFGK